MVGESEWKRSVRAAFAVAPIAGEGAFAQRGATYPDGDEYARRIDGKTWDELDDAYLARRSDALSFLGDEHLAALLPAYLNLLLALGPRSPVPETLLPLLTEPDPKKQKAKDRFDALVARLSETQCALVADALARFAADFPPYADPAMTAMNNYWVRYAKRG